MARISLINGDVSVRRGDSGDWVAGVVNAPLLTDDRVATGPNSRTEVQFDASNLLRLGANGELRLTQLEYGRYQMELARGVMTYRMLHTSDGNIEIDTPSLSVRPSRQGSFRISVNEGGETEVTARDGDVEVFTPRGSQWVRGGQTLMARGASSDAEFQVVPAGGMDEWDRWSDNRDRTITQSVSSRYVGPGVYGAEDLDAHGTWTNVPEYGNVWRPTVTADWAPYQSGRWVWEDWYGWTWVSYDPFGWAPYHYGRWFNHDRYGWCWYPGLLTSRHYWSPALVGFFGFGHGGFGVGFGFGNVGWVPLAPYEVFHPWWGRGYYGNRGFNRSMNITNVNIT
ncbi:MAG: FecR family protein, partial [Candidatus Solibacter sp.]|nr:FecR family protein [Candidatus Solibacter sp.]